MVKAFSVKRINASVQKALKKDIQTAFKRVAVNLRGVISQNADADGKISMERSAAVRQATGAIILEMFVGSDGRSAFAEDGITALSPFATIMNKHYARVVAEQVRAQQTWLKHNLPDDLYGWLSRPKRTSEAVNPYLQRDDETLEEYKARAKALRIFAPNPLIQYDPMHTWVSPDGYTLSDRIWRAGEDTRKVLDAMLADAIQKGMGAEQLSRLLEQFLIPERALLRTKKPYGRDASYYAMRLARTEIARAANQTAYTSALLNPYVGGIDIARSASGDPKCKECPKHATIDIGQNRVREPYEPENCPIPPFHAQDMCRLQPNVTDSPAAVTKSLRELMVVSATDPTLTPNVNPASGNLMIMLMIGASLMKFVPDEE